MPSRTTLKAEYTTHLAGFVEMGHMERWDVLSLSIKAYY